MSGFPEVRLRGHNSVNLDQSPERASASFIALETISIKSNDITAQECERDARLARQGGPRCSLETLDSGRAKEGSENRSMLPLAFTNFLIRKLPSVPLGSWSSFWTANRGIFWVILAMFFGSLMAMTTRLLELEIKDRKGMQPIHVSQSTFSIKNFDSIVSRYCYRVCH